MPRKTMILILLAGAAVGCGDFRKYDYPRFPKWEWWKHPVPKDAKDKDDQDDKPAADVSSTPPAKEPRPPAAEVSANSMEQKALAVRNHRQLVWREVAPLRNLDELPYDRREKLLQQARQKIKAWYKPMLISAPDVNNPDWIMVLVWDFMPEDQFQCAVENWRPIAEKQKVPFPTDITRRELMKLIRRIINTETPTTAPAGHGKNDGKYRK